MNSIINIKFPLFPLLIKFLLVTFAFLIPTYSIAQDQNILTNEEILSKEDGLISRSIYHVYQDKQGFVWCATSLGLCRYNGVDFETYSNKPVLKIFEDRNGQMWLIENQIASVAKGSIRLFKPVVSRLNVATKKLLNLNENQEEVPFLIKDLSDINQDIEYNLWFSTLTGKVYKYNGETYKLIYDNKGIAAIGGALPVAKQQITFFEEELLVTVDLKKGERSEEEMKLKIYEVFVDKNNRYWFITDRNYDLHEGHQRSYFDGNKIFFKDPDNRFAKYVFEDADYLKDKKIKALWFDKVSRDGKIWRLEGEEVKSFDKDGKLIREGSLPENISNSISVNVGIILNTKDNLLWVSAVDGLHKILIQKDNIKNILKREIGNAVSTRGLIRLDDEQLLIGNYYYGLINYNLKNHSFKKISTGIPFPNTKFITYGIAEDEYGRIWVGTAYSNLHEYHKEVDSISTFNIPSELEAKWTQLQIPFWDTSSKKLWIGTIRSGLYYLNEKTKSCLPFERYNEFIELKDARVNCFHQKGGDVWAGSSEGLFVFNEKEGVIKLYNNLLSKNILGIAEDEEGVFWLGTSEGLLKWNPLTNEQRLFSKKDRFSDDYIYSVHLDEFGFLWLPSNLGLMRFDRETEEVQTLLSSSGISDTEFNFSSNFTDENGVLYLGTVNGVNIIDPKDFVNIEKENIDLVVTDFNVLEEEGEMVNMLDQLSNNNKIDFLPNYKSIQLDFALQDYSVNGAQKYAYKIGGHSESWTYIDENYIRLNKLPFGTFELMIKGIGGRGHWSEPLVIPIKVPKPFYLTAPFLLSYVSLMLLAIISFVKWRLMILEKRQLKLEKLVEERTEELSEKNKELEEANQFKDKVYSIIAHDLRGPAFGLQGVGLKLNYLIKTKQFAELHNFGDNVEESISRLNSLLDNLLKWANQNMKSISINKEAIELKEMIEHSLLEQKVSWSQKELVMENVVDEKTCLFADKQTVLTIFRNLLSNAIKFTPKGGRISISSEIKEGKVVIEIRDNGIGICQDRLPNIFDIKKNQSTLGTNGEKGTGLGLGVCKELTILNAGELTVSSVDGEGTIFHVVLPAHSQLIYA